MTPYRKQTLHSYLLILFCGEQKKNLFPVDAVRLCNIFPRYLVNDTIFENNVLNLKCVLWFSLQLLSEIFLILQRV